MRRLLLALPLAAAAAAAQPAPPDTTLPEVSVVATRIAAPAGETPVRVTVLDAHDARAADARSVADILEARAPAQLRRYGAGGIATLSVRGAGAGQVAVLLDGHAVADPQLGMVDLSLIPASVVSRVELVHGAGSALHGAGAIGGVVALSTPMPGPRPAASVESRAGAWGERGVDATATFRAGGAGVVVAGTATAARDDYPYFDPNAGVAGSEVRRAGADRALGSLFARIATEGTTRVTAGVWAGAAERGAPGAVGTAPDQGGRQWDRHARAWADVATPTLAGLVRAGAMVHHGTLRYVGTASNDIGRTWAISGEAELRGAPARGWSVAAGAGAAIATAHHPSLADDAREGRLSSWVAATRRAGAVTVFPAARLDGYVRRDAPAILAVSPRLGATLAAGRSLVLRGSAGTAFRPPTFNDRFWRYADPAAPGGDPGLRPERGWTVDAGGRLDAGRLVVDATLYAGATRDQIVWLPAAGGLYAPQNIGRTVARGLELAVDLAEVAVGRVRAGAGASYSFTDARDRSSPGSVAYDRQLRYVARHAAGARAGAATVLAGTSLRADLHARVLGGRPTRADGGAPLPAHRVVDAVLRAGRRVGGADVELGVAVRNATDTRYAVVEGYPMPPRHASLTLRITL